MAAPIAPALPDIPSRSAPEADFDAKMFALFKWATDDFVGFMEDWRSYLDSGAGVIRGSNANGAYVRFPDGTQICTHLVELSYSVPDLMFGIWAFPAAFSTVTGLVLEGSVDNDSATANLTPTRNELGQVFVDVATASVGHLGLRNQIGATGFGASDTVLLHMTATGRWF
ncbi:hypothetical protein ACFP4H_11820 [Pseudophaeobacter arcticus]|uniref:hypothetical protein n=1 Tax=Pseudophaeobacter arcticus TaxID=385492 RepID=UPI0003FF8EAC|nr:hypothetical protein [Pseudophaeobacter arcticus]